MSMARPIGNITWPSWRPAAFGLEDLRSSETLQDEVFAIPRHPQPFPLFHVTERRRVPGRR